MRRASSELSEASTIHFAKLAKRIFRSTTDADAALAGLATVGIRARLRPEDFSLLPARYHFFTNGINNVTVRLSDSNPEGFADARLAEPIRG